jgi:hypothetical protein
VALAIEELLKTFLHVAGILDDRLQLSHSLEHCFMRIRAVGFGRVAKERGQALYGNPARTVEAEHLQLVDDIRVVIANATLPPRRGHEAHRLVVTDGGGRYAGGPCYLTDRHGRVSRASQRFTCVSR